MDDDGPPPGEEEEYVDALGVIAALERTCELEARLRQAIQDTHPLTTTLDWDFNAADREREGLLAISEQLEYLEDKLREYRFLEPSELDNKAVLLGQLDGVRRELVEVVARWGPHILFGKELVREVLAFAQVSEEDDAPEDGEEPSGGTGSAGSSGLPDGVGVQREPSDVELLQAARRLRHQGSGGSGSMGGFASEFEPEEEVAPRVAAVQGLQRRSTADLHDGQGLGSEQGALIPAVRRSTAAGLARPPRYPAGASKEQQLGGKQRLGAPSAASPKRQQTATQLGVATSPPSLHEQHQLAAQQTSPPGRSAFLQHQQEQSSLSHQRGYLQPSQVQRGGWEDERERRLEATAVPGSRAASPGAAATVSAMRSATAASRGASGRRQLDVDAAAAGGRGARAPRGGLGGTSSDSYSFGPREAQAAGLASYPPSSYAPSESAPSSRQSPYSARGGAPLGGGPGGGPPARPSSSLLSKLNRAQQGGGYADSASRYTGYTRLRDEDIYGALDDGPGGRPTSLRPASIVNPSPRQFGGYVRIRDRLSQAEAAAKTPEVQEQRREPMPPRIYGEPDSEEIQPASYAASPAASRERRSGRTGIIVDDPPALQPSPARSERLALAYSSGGAGVSGRPAFSDARGGTSRPADRDGRGGGFGRLLGGVARLLLTGAAAAAVAVAAQKAGPVVMQKGQQAAARLAEEQHRLAERWQERQQRKREQAAAQAQRKREQQTAAAAQQHLQPRAAAGGKTMADLRPRPGSGPRGLADAPPSHLRAAAGRQATPPPQPKGGDAQPWARSQAATAAAAAAKAAASKQQPQQPSRQQAPQGRPARGSTGRADPLPPHLAAAARNGGVPGRVPPVAQVHPPPHGMLFPAMPPPDVSASMG